MKYSIFTCVALIIVSCSNPHATDHKNIFEIIEHFSKQEDKTKTEAAEFIAENAVDFQHTKGSLLNKFDLFFQHLDSLNKNNISKKADRKSLKLLPEIEMLWDSIQKSIKREDYSSLKKVHDFDALPSEYFINNIELAVKEWKENPWSHHVSYKDFCEYILPYKVYDEQPENWRQYFLDRYSKVKDTIHSSNPVYVADIINKDIEKWFKFSTLFYEYPFDMGLDRLIQGQVGGCKHMVTVTAYANRALGIPCAVDFAPHYGNRSLGHNWLVVFDRNMNAIPYNGASSEWLNMGYVFHKQTTNVKIPKIYRRMFSTQKNNFDSLINQTDYTPQFFLHKHLIDVTKDYMPVSTVTLQTSGKMPSDKKLAYLCIFNNKTWVPVEWGEVRNGKVTYENMGQDIVYLPVYYMYDQMIPFSEPIILTKEGIVLPIKKYKGKAQSAKLFYKYPPELTAVNDSTNAILNDNVYELFYWDNRWISLGKKTTADRKADIDSLGFDFNKPLFFNNIKNREFIFYENVPVGTLFLLHNYTQGKEERIFTIENNEQVWW